MKPPDWSKRERAAAEGAVDTEGQKPGRYRMLISFGFYFFLEGVGNAA